jgi:hypothetical protein
LVAQKQVKGAGAEFDDAIQLKEIDPASRTVPHAGPLPHEGMQGKSATGLTPRSRSSRRSIGRLS